MLELKQPSLRDVRNFTRREGGRLHEIMERLLGSMSEAADQGPLRIPGPRWRTLTNNAEEDIEWLLTRLAALSAVPSDTERLDWLERFAREREMELASHSPRGLRKGWSFTLFGQGVGTTSSEQSIRAAIDAARSSEPIDQ